MGGGSQELDLKFVGNRKLIMILTNDVYYKFNDKHKWMEETWAIKIWGFRKSITQWFNMTKAGWCS